MCTGHQCSFFFFLSHQYAVVMVVESLKTVCSIIDYCSPVLCLGANQKTPSPSLVAFYNTPEKVWAASIFFVACLLGSQYAVSSALCTSLRYARFIKVCANVCALYKGVRRRARASQIDSGF